jgi:2-dehydropantoate 2-reductase
VDILVYGAGAIGGYLGAKLAVAGNNVALVGRPETAALINAGGLKITESGTTRCLSIPAFGSPADALHAGFHPELVIMGMKCYDIAAAIEPLASVCPGTAVIMGTQNGIGVETPLIERFGPERVVAGVLTVPVSKLVVNELIVERANRGMGLAPTQPGQDVGRWLTLFRGAGIRVEPAADYQALKWSKVLLNIVGNASSAILNRPPAILYKSPLVFQLEMRMLREALDVMKRLRLPLINLPGAPARQLAAIVRHAPRFLLQPLFIRLVIRGRGDKMPSFYIDLQAGKGRSEVVYHNGAIAEAGQAAGIATPVNRAFNDILLKLIRRELDATEFDGNPQRLAVEVANYL